jgi:uncharacterized membrane protein YoaK (UPF0700 family)
MAQCVTRRHVDRFEIQMPTLSSLLRLQLLTAVLGLIAGSLEVISLLGSSRMFTAHVTGNLVILAAHLVGGDPIQLAGLLSLPVFVLALGLARLLAGALEAIGYATLRPLLLLQFVLLATFLVLALVELLGSNTAASLITIGGLLGVSAMAVQNGLVQLSLKEAPATAVMTTNVVRLATDIGTLLLQLDREQSAKAAQRVNKTWPAVAGFTIGCGLGATCEARFGLLSLMLPTSLSLAALVMAGSTEQEGRAWKVSAAKRQDDK